jgi:hypothetical protein
LQRRKEVSFIISVYTHEGIVMATDSRLTLNASAPAGTGVKDISFDSSNSAKKLFCTPNGIGISTCGDAGIGNIPLAGYVEHFINGNKEAHIEELPERLLNHFVSLAPTLSTDFHVCGYTPDGLQRVFRVSTSMKTVTRVNDDNMQGTVWNGETDIFSKLINSTWLSDQNGNPTTKLPNYPIPYEFFTLQDAVDFSIFAMTTTIGAIRFQNRIKTVGGPIDIFCIKQEKSFWIQRKEIHGEKTA